CASTNRPYASVLWPFEPEQLFCLAYRQHSNNKSHDRGDYCPEHTASVPLASQERLDPVRNGQISRSRESFRRRLHRGCRVSVQYVKELGKALDVLEAQHVI